MARAATPSFPTHRCGAFLYWEVPQNGQAGFWWRVSVLNRGVSCAAATTVIRELWYGQSVQHGGPSDAETSFTLPRFPGWQCQEGPVGGVCTEGGAVAGFDLGAIDHLPPTSPCELMWPGGTAKRLSQGRLVYSRAQSRRMVCDGFGTTVAGQPVDWADPGLQCALIATTVGIRYSDTAGMFADGVCSASELVHHPGLVSGLGATCTAASDLLGISIPEVGQLSGLLCAAAPAVGTGIGTKLESNHEFAVAKDVVHRGRCLQYREFLGISSWTAVRCLS